jgi:hypothetical protein
VNYQTFIPFVAHLSFSVYIYPLHISIVHYYSYLKIPTITSRLHILADIADQMEQDPSSNEKNANTNLQQLFFKCLIESIQKQQQNGPIDFSTNTIKKEITEQSSSPPKHNKSIRPFNAYRLSLPLDIYSSSNSLLHSNEELLNRIQQENSIPFKKRVRPCTPPSDKDQHGTYSERRRKNNEAAKRSRDVRRVKEDEIALR